MLGLGGCGGADWIGRAKLDDSRVEPGFITMVSRSPSGLGFTVGGVAVDGGRIYWANPAAHTIGRANLDGTHVEQSFVTVPLSAPGVPSGRWRCCRPRR